MTRFVHRLYLSFYVSVVAMAFLVLGYIGLSYYKLPIEDRYFHPDYALLKPSGLLGHGLGITGTLLLLIGVFSYMARKRIRLFLHVGVLKYWLEFHIFLCALGPVLILYHTSFKFGGIVSVSFWSLVAVVASGILGRFIYLQRPHSIEGRELSLLEVQDMKNELGIELKTKYNIDISELSTGEFSQIESELRALKLPVHEYGKVKHLIGRQIILAKRMERLDMMQNLFKYWHVAHLPFAIITLIIVVVHVIVVLTFGYKWIF
ncbi:MAG TPA: hypothetical protein VGK38_14030 [Prolixibacteraceae bacterium]|jgi:hypothetical protein